MTADTKATATRLVPLREGMFVLPEDIDLPARLLGSRCPNCHESFFPRRVFCAACCGGNLEPIELSGSGEIETFTIVHQQPPNALIAPPYAIVRVRLDGGPSVQTVVPANDLDGVTIGARALLFIRRVKDDEAGNTVVSFMAQPVPPSR